MKDDTKNNSKKKQVVEMPERVTMSAEAFVLGDYRKHNTNGGCTIGARTTPQAFSHLDFNGKAARFSRFYLSIWIPTQVFLFGANQVLRFFVLHQNQALMAKKLGKNP